MPTTRLRFQAPYQPETPWGAALANAANMMFGGPTAYEVEAQQARRDASRADAALKTNELEGRGRQADLVAEWQAAAADPATREQMFKTYAPRFAETALRYGYDPAKAIEAFRFSLATPMASEQNRAFGAYATKGSIAPFSSFGDLGAQRAAEGRETSSKATVAATGAAAANPDKYQIVAERKAILAGQPPNSPDRRIIAGFENRPSEREMSERRTERALGLTPTEREQYEMLNGQLKTFMSQSPTPQSAMAQFERAFPGGLKRLGDFQNRMMGMQSRPPVRGAEIVNGKAYVPNPMEPGRMVEAKRDGAGWYFEYGGKRYDLDQPDYR